MQGIAALVSIGLFMTGKSRKEADGGAQKCAGNLATSQMLENACNIVHHRVTPLQYECDRCSTSEAG